jgi:hypothetical protein
MIHSSARALRLAGQPHVAIRVPHLMQRKLHPTDEVELQRAVKGCGELKGLLSISIICTPLCMAPIRGGVRAGPCASLIFESSDLSDSENTIPFSTLYSLAPTRTLGAYSLATDPTKTRILHSEAGTSRHSPLLCGRAFTSSGQQLFGSQTAMVWPSILAFHSTSPAQPWRGSVVTDDEQEQEGSSVTAKQLRAHKQACKQVREQACELQHAT